MTERGKVANEKHNKFLRRFVLQSKLDNLDKLLSLSEACFLRMSICKNEVD